MISLGDHVVGVLKDLEDVAEGEAEREATEVVPVAGELEVGVDDSVSDLLQYLGLQGEGRLEAGGAAPPPPEQVGQDTVLQNRIFTVCQDAVLKNKPFRAGTTPNPYKSVV